MREECFDEDKQLKTIFTQGKDYQEENFLVITQVDRWEEKYQVELGELELKELKEFLENGIEIGE